MSEVCKGRMGKIRDVIKNAEGLNLIKEIGTREKSINVFGGLPP